MCSHFIGRVRIPVPASNMLMAQQVTEIRNRPSMIKSLIPGSSKLRCSTKQTRPSLSKMPLNPKIGQFFSQTFVGQSVGNSRIYRVKEFQNPTCPHVPIVSLGIRWRKESADAVSKEKDLQKLEAEEQPAARRQKMRSRWRLGEHTNPFEPGRRSRNQKLLPITLRSHNGE